MSKIVGLSNADFNQSGNLVDTNISGLVLFQADWCGHCKVLKPVWEEVSKNYTVYKVDCTDRNLHSELTKTLGLKGFPTIYVFQKGAKQAEYSGGRSADDIKNYISTHFKKVRFEEPSSSVVSSSGSGSEVAVKEKSSCDNTLFLVIIIGCIGVIGLIVYTQRKKKSE